MGPQAGAVTRDAILEAAAAFAGWRYAWGLDRDARALGCTSLLGLVLIAGYQLAHRANQHSDWWRDVSIWDPTRPWSGLYAVRKSPGGHLVAPRSGPERPALGAWLAVYMWRELDGPVDQPEERGHCVLWRVSDDDPWLGWSLESQEGIGPCIGTADGYIPLGDALEADGTPRPGLQPMRWADRMGRYAHLGWVVLPPLPTLT